MKVKLLRVLREKALHDPFYSIKEGLGGFCIYVHYPHNIRLFVGSAFTLSDAVDKVCYYRRLNILDRLNKYKRIRKIVKKFKLWS